MLPNGLKLDAWLAVIKNHHINRHKIEGGDKISYELEIRFKSFRTSAFSYGVPYRDFDRLHAYMKNGDEYKLLPIIYQTDQSQNLGHNSKIRKTIITDKPDLWIRKTRLPEGDYKDPEYHLRYTLNQEMIISPLPGFKVETERIKKRWSYLMMNGYLRVDLTEVVMIIQVESIVNNQRVINRVQQPPSYEVELEVVNPTVSLNDLSRAIEIIFKVLHDTENIYTAQEYINIVNYINRTLWQKSNDPYTISPWGLFQARNLHYNDMVSGGLIAHGTYKENSDETITYSVTVKADGIRKLLVISPSGTWLVMSKDKANLVSRKQPREFRGRVGYILEGELIPIDRRKSGGPTEKYWFLTYDCLAIRSRDVLATDTAIGNMSIQEKPHSERMAEAQILVNLLRDDGLLLIQTKVFKGFNTGYEMFAAIRELNLLIPSNYYNDDGFIFTPEEMPYNFKINKGTRRKPFMVNVWSLPLHERVLTRHPDICKWKPFKELTIDFQIRPKMVFGGQTEIELLSGLPKGKVSPFIGTKNFIFPVGQVELPKVGTLTHGLPPGTVVEYRWDNLRNLMVPVRIRYDKHRPNLKVFADDTWNLIQNPIGLSTILGDDFKLMQKYHNRIKRNLFNTAFTKLRKRHEQPILLTALDIGSGRGGDTAKLKRFDRIIFLEPQLDYLVELSTRIRSVYMQNEVEILSSGDNILDKVQIAMTRRDKAIILNTGGENSPFIRQVVIAWLEGKASLISIMLSMSFFWLSPKMVKAFETTILENLSPTGEGIFFTIDGELVRHAFNPVLQTNGIRIGGQSTPSDKVILGGAILEYFATESKLIITIPDTIVINQTEYPPYLADLEPGLRAGGWVINHLEQADQELLLNTGEYTLSKLYMAGRIQPEGFVDEDPLVSRGMHTNLRKTQEHRRTRHKSRRKLAHGPQSLIPQICVPGRGSSVRISKKITAAPKSSVDFNLIKLPIPIKTMVSPKSYPLPMIPVWYDPTKDIAVGDDTVKRINVTWYTAHPVVRIGTIGDGSCFFHALLKAFYAPYANKNKYSIRVDLARKLRRDLASILEMKDPDSVANETYYQTAAKGSWVEYSKQQLIGANFGVDFRLPAIQTSLNSSGDVGDEVYQFVGDLLGINIYVMNATQIDLHPMLNTSIGGRYQPSVVIAGNGYHYETVGIDSGLGVGIQTVFYPNDPFLIALRSKIDDQGGDNRANILPAIHN